MKTNDADNGEVFGLVKDYQDQPIKFEDGSNYICNGTNDGVGSGLDHTSILQKNDKIYAVSQFECQIGAMYMFEIEQDENGVLSSKPDTLQFISQKDDFGGFVHCAGQTTPWQSHLGSEEYETDARMVEEDADENGLTGDAYYDEVAKYWGNDATKMSPYFYGWTPEVKIDANGEPVYTKHYSMGRFSHELSYVMPDERTVYLSDDGTNVGLFMYVADEAGDLSAGTLYAAKLTQQETYQGGKFGISWIDLGHATDDEIKTKVAEMPTFSDIFETQQPTLDYLCGTGFTPVNTTFGVECLKVKTGMETYASRLETRRYAAIQGATTELRKEEGISYDPVHQKLYIGMSEINQGMEDNKKYGVDNDVYDRGGPNHIRLPDNGCGAVYALDLDSGKLDGAPVYIDSDLVAQNMYAILIGEAVDYGGTDYEGNSCDIDKIANPDNVSYIANSNTLIIGEDTSAHRNNMVWAYNVETGDLTRIATVAVGAETTSPFWHMDIGGHSYMTLVTQHPDAGDKESFVGVIGAPKDTAVEYNENSGYNGEIKVPDYTVPGPGDIEEEKPACYTTGDGLVFKSNFECASLLPWLSYSVAGSDDWVVSAYGGNYYAYSSGYGADEASDDWLISPQLNLSGDETLSFRSAKGYSGSEIVVYISNDYLGSGNPNDATWINLNATVADTDSGNYVWKDSGDIDLSTYAGTAYIAFHHKAAGTTSGTVANWEVDDVIISGSGEVIVPFEVEIASDVENVTTISEVTFTATISGGTTPYTYLWDLGDGTTSTDAVVTHTFDTAGEYEVSVTITDADDATTSATFTIDVGEPLDEAVPAKAGDLRIATYNAYLNRTALGALHAELVAGTNQQIKNVAEVLQHVNADVVFLNEFDYNGTAQVELFINAYLKVAQGASASGIDYPYYYTTTVNTGVQPDTPQDFNNDDITGGADDAYGYGEFPGQYGMVVLSKYPIDTENIRTFQNFLWNDMPDALWPTNEDGTQWYSDEEKAIFRLSSKSHWDVPVTVNGKTVHILGAHPTPPTFDGDEDRNGKRNHDEIRLWADYVSQQGDYLYDDNGVFGGLEASSRFVILGDYNADPDEGDSYDNAIDQFLGNSAINAAFTPVSEGAPEDDLDEDDTANWGMRADYVLPSAFGFTIEQGGVFWPKKNDIKHYLIEQLEDGGEASSDHRLVWLDLSLSDGTPVASNVENFSTLTLGDWKAESLASDKNWEATTHDEGVTTYAKMSGYGGNEFSDDWLVSPLIAFGYDQVFNFVSATNYDGPALEVLVSTDYTLEGGVGNATWTALGATLSEGGWTWTDSGNIDLSSYSGTGAVAFRYTSDESGSATWEIDDIVIAVKKFESDFSDLTLGVWSAYSVASDKNWEAATHDGGTTTYAKMSGYGGNEYSDDWLISPPIAFDGTQVLSFQSATNYDGPALEIMVSTDYDGSGNPSDATWTTLSAELSDGGWTWVASGDVALSGFEGIGYIAFRYTSDESGAATWELDDISLTKKIVNVFP